MKPDNRILDLIRQDLGMKPKPAEPPEPDDALTINTYHVPPVTTASIVDNVCYGKGGWKTIERVLQEEAFERRERKFREKYELVPIPQPEFDPEDRDL
jgi:hypothetical protein